MRSTRGQFGLLPMSETFNEGIHMLLYDLEEEGVFHYADDILILAKSMAHCIWLLSIVLKRLRENGYVINYQKCILFKEELNILGELVSTTKVRVDPKRIEAI